MSDKFNQVNETFFASPQITADDIADAAAMGVTVVINNRPDGEEPGQPAGADIEAAASAAGLAYVHIPVGASGITPDHLDAFDQALSASSDGAALAYCKSGMRSVMVASFAAARAGAPVQEIVSNAAAADYDIAGHAPALQSLTEAAKQS